MYHKFNRFVWFYLLLIFNYIFVLQSPLTADDEKDHYLRLKRSWQYMQRVYEHINQHYVEEVDPYPLIKSGIDGMLQKLDPYTVFIEKEGERRLRMYTTGKYGGLGMEIGLRGNNVTVIAPIDNSPAKRLGILAGDIIEMIDGQNISGWSIDKVSSRLQGKIGTPVQLVIKRPGLDEPLELNMTREEIVIEDIGYYGYLEPGVAYVSLSGFTDKAADEFRDAIEKLEASGNIDAFILDLRGNPGGLLESAVDIANVFVSKGELIVYTKGFREEQYKFFTDKDPILPDIPLVVLVDGGSASASEIVAGALQDLDRAVIVGEPTFGKGLVQKVYSIDKNRDAKLKVTTAKYYVPSGRCIQKKDYSSENNVIVRDSTKETQSEAVPFFTKNKRKVLDKGGVHPDVFLKSDSTNYILVDLIRKSMIFDFCVDYHYKYPQWDGTFTISDSVILQFRRYLQNKNYTFDIECRRDILNIEQTLAKKNINGEITDILSLLKDKLEQQKHADFENNLDQIRRHLRLELAEKYFDRRERERLSLEDDEQIIGALNILNNSKQYATILSID